MTTTLPHWDMSVVYPSLNAPEFARDFATTLDEIAALVALFDTHAINKRERAPLDPATVAAFEAAVAALNTTFDRVGTLRAYIYSFVATNSRDTQAQARLSEFQQGMVRVSQLVTRFTAWIGSLDVDALIDRSEVANEYAFLLREAQRLAAYLMTPAEESLATELNVTGGNAWNRLYNNAASQLLVPISIDGQPPELPISALRNLAYDPDRETRRRAYEAELAAWQRAALPLSAALNSIKGEVNTLSRRRGWAMP